MAHEPLAQEEALLEGFLALDTPEGFRAELIEGEIGVTPPPDGDHEDYFSAIVEQVFTRSTTRMRASGNKGLKVPRGGLCPKNHLIPDATFAPAEARLFRGAEPWMPCEGVAMVVEVTSTKPDSHRKSKRHCYALGGIPLYLLVDRDNASVTLFSDPEDDEYRQADMRPFGKPVKLPEPFSFWLETDELT
ncbi:Uma2 family endonuclease [Streptomyces sp. H10-C2]|uniref:Uma2 family endonuclease n=1 Tax=unclassified Streptomyces TaxID=2593676 RepID=UPI0024B9489A|nr:MULTISPECIES: Uma2 family endonuclease [unclassified Streptomyces]MDJ0346571.1 Uma2 family endonuclease [Streptomyces sp. PH10-H1]MDJ0374191.1 Uma2 family endonuclease [Streptomyces sp. H10-C2]